jgi:HSP20 family protein
MMDERRSLIMLQQPIFGNSFLTPWREMARWQQEMNRLFSGVPSPTNGHTAPGYPAMNILTNQEGAVVTAELPGIDLDNIDISITGDILTLTGSRQPGQLPEGAKYHRQERGFGQFSRTIRLPFQVAVGQVEAVFKNGILHISLPRTEADKPKKITVNAANA